MKYLTRSYMFAVLLLFVLPNNTWSKESKNEKSSVPKRVIEDHIIPHIPRFLECYEKELKKNRKLKGTVTMGWTVNKLGEVRDDHIMKSTAKNENLEKCTLRVLRNISFPRLHNGESYQASYPLVFQSR